MTRALPPWHDRPREEANLFNPAFTSLLVARAVVHHERAVSSAGMPFALAFLVLPIVLHPPTRAALPRAADTNLFGWIAEHADIKTLFPARAERLAPVTQEAVRFALTYKKLAVQGGGLVSGSMPYALTAAPSPTTDETRECLQGAAFLGRWFAAAKSPVNILGAWGVRP